MERSEILAAMGGLKLFGMKAAYDEIVATAVKRQYEPHRIIGDLLVSSTWSTASTAKPATGGRGGSPTISVASTS
jgi:hypothetical protein